MGKIAILIFTALVFSGCKKTNENDNCTALKNAAAAGNVQQANEAITAYINILPSADYTEINIKKLTETIASGCGITSGVDCFNCILTLPSQTEIAISFTAAGNTVRKTIDITYTAATNKMKFGNMHD